MRVQSLGQEQNTHTHMHTHTHTHTYSPSLSEEQREQRSSLFMTEAKEHTQRRVWASLWVRDTLQSFLIPLLSYF